MDVEFDFRSRKKSKQTYDHISPFALCVGGIMR